MVHPEYFTRWTPLSSGLGRSSNEYSKGIVNAIIVPLSSFHICTGAVIAIIVIYAISFLGLILLVNYFPWEGIGTG